MGKLKKGSLGSVFAGVFFVFLTAYYVYRVYSFTPWYDELYTYKNFIDRGFMYSITHWPLPNNHLFFSALSSLLVPFGRYMALRGISMVSAVATAALLYALLKSVSGRLVACFGTAIYVSMGLVNNMAVQGRGYSLATCFLMLSIYCGYRIYMHEGEKAPKRYYILWCVALWLSMYTLVSSVYWIIGLCLSFGIMLLVTKQTRKLVKLVLSSLAAAALTGIVYCFLWANMGARAISTELGSSLSDFRIILEYPRSCLLRGFALMRDNQFMQSDITPDVFIRDYKYHFSGLFMNFTHIVTLKAIYIYIGIMALMVILTVLLSRKKKPVVFLTVTVP
ncbi:MAG: hypothetical protein J5626_10655, partial [Lachnospiraceae bacterium]|nr:hypothetical protein [Lachnospiraceae bacterium]